MKRFLFAVLVLLAGSSCSKAQCVIYNCTVSGAWGIGYNETGTPTTIADCEEYALKGCKLNGGVRCGLMYKSPIGGWWAVMAGRTTKGPFYFAHSEGNVTQVEAERDVKKKYIAKGGPNPELTVIKSWYVYSTRPGQ